MHSFTHHHKKSGEAAAPPSQARGAINMRPWFYDLMARWFVMHGQEKKFRQMIIDLAQIQTGEAVLDVGCGTGTLALTAKKRVGNMGRVCGIDPSESLLGGARRKAKRAGLLIDFQLGGIEQLPLPSQSFDVVLSTFMLHHVPDEHKRQGLAEIARVLKTGARLLIVDFKRADDLPALMQEVGLSQIEIGEIPFQIRSVAAGHQHYGFVMARKSSTTVAEEG